MTRLSAAIVSRAWAPIEGMGKSGAPSVMETEGAMRLDVKLAKWAAVAVSARHPGFYLGCGPETDPLDAWPASSNGSSDKRGEHLLDPRG